MNAYTTTARGISEIVTFQRSRRTEHGFVVASSHHADRPARFVVASRGKWFLCNRSDKDGILFDRNTDGLTPMTDDECDAVGNGEW